MKKRLSNHSRPSPSHFKGVVSLSTAAMPPLDATDDNYVPNQLPNHDSTSLTPNIFSGGSGINGTDLRSSPNAGSMNTRQDAVSDSDNLLIHSNNNMSVYHEALIPSANPKNGLHPVPTATGSAAISRPLITNVRSRKGKQNRQGGRAIHSKRQRQKRKQTTDVEDGSAATPTAAKWCLWCCPNHRFRQNIQTCMNFVARLLLWCTIFASVALVVWYSYELKNNGCVSYTLLWHGCQTFKQLLSLRTLFIPLL
jgi:hypothetical protein